MAENSGPGGINWDVDLAKLEAATTIVAAEGRSIQLQDQTIKGLLDRISTAWQSPSGDSFVALKASFQAAATTLEELLAEAVVRMRTAHANYADAEHKNSQMLR